jgi:hypothetical protein
MQEPWSLPGRAPWRGTRKARGRAPCPPPGRAQNRLRASMRGAAAPERLSCAELRLWPRRTASQCPTGRRTAEAQFSGARPPPRRGRTQTIAGAVRFKYRTEATARLSNAFVARFAIRPKGQPPCPKHPRGLGGATSPEAGQKTRRRLDGWSGEAGGSARRGPAASRKLGPAAEGLVEQKFGRKTGREFSARIGSGTRDLGSRKMLAETLYYFTKL